MLCPGCVAHGIPQAKAIHAAFPPDKVRVIGLHTVFEHHAAMGPVSLEAFVHEYRLSFPIAIDTPRSKEHTSELQSLMRNSYAVFCLNKKKAERNKNEVQQTTRRQTEPHNIEDNTKT